MKRLALAIALGAGCVTSPDESTKPTFGGRAAFEAEAQPIVTERCANPSCHGDASRPFSLYAVRRHRADPRDVYAETPLTDEEIDHNFAQTTAFLIDVSTAQESLLLVKPLAREAGGGGHAGGAVFADDHDYGYRRLRAWIEAALAADRSAP